MLVFDLDDTLYLERDFAFSGYDHLEGWMRSRVGRNGFGRTCEHLFKSGERRRIFNRACAHLGIEDTTELIAELVDEYRNHPPRIELCPDAQRFLQTHQGPFGLITDGPEPMQRAKIAALGVDRLIEHLCPTGAWPEGYGKPHPRAYELMERLAADHQQMVYVADNPAKDFVTPKARGWLTVQIERPGGVHAPNAPDEEHAAAVRITSLDELDALISSI
ncbi:HAD family hydrolase [uncultured Aliiroseovarius sp.]|uniref:HAD family hydrolase n=1 Tax=uncultured Aliiroseovarius sp. TaxID=1658783 RepID=UPI0026181828|nr:HAD family hydrolase [uncultured Aliiroseovarius sp.]